MVGEAQRDASYVFVAGTRPEAVKLAPVVLALQAQRQPTLLIATGQHRALFHEALAGFGLAADVDLDIMRQGQTPEAVISALVPLLTSKFKQLRPAVVIVQGDTASALAGAMAAHYAQCPLAHVEAGLRSGQRNPFPEEMHRRNIGQMADVHFAPTAAAVLALSREGIQAENVYLTGNTGIDALLVTRARLALDAEAVAKLAIRFASINRQRPLIVVTVHRRENHGTGLDAVLDAVADLARLADVVIPVHPSPAVSGPVHKRLDGVAGVHVVPALEYPAFVWLLAQATLVLTDSGGVQEEAPALGVPVLVLRQVTERPEGVASGNALLVGTDRGTIVAAVERLLADSAARVQMSEPALPYGAGDAAVRIAALLVTRFGLVPGTLAGAGSACTKGQHHGNESREAGSNRAGVVDGDGCAAVQAKNGEAHGDAVVKFSSDSHAAGHGTTA
jgi:UDP-N-acetylglucosamine 2-epimerase (non-hydrolysing)